MGGGSGAVFVGGVLVLGKKGGASGMTGSGGTASIGTSIIGSGGTTSGAASFTRGRGGLGFISIAGMTGELVFC